MNHSVQNTKTSKQIKMAYDFVPYSMHQHYDEYTPEDFEIWKILFNRQIAKLPDIASKEYLEGIKKVNFSAERIPDYEETNKLLRSYTGWQIHVVPGLIANRPFFELMQAKNFCASTWLRSFQQLDYLEEPDMFHDIFGHVPLLSNQSVCHFLEELARIALRFVESEDAVEIISRIYWFTVEFGLIKEDGQLKIYGAGILSSSGESTYCLLDPTPQRVPFNVTEIFDTPYIKEHYQDKYFIIDSYRQLFDSIPEIESALEKRMKDNKKYSFQTYDTELGKNYANV